MPEQEGGYMREGDCVTFGPEPINIKGILLNESGKKAMFEVIELLQANGLSVYDSQKVLEAASSEIGAVAAHEKL